MQAALGLSVFFSLLGKVIKMALGQVLSRAEDNLALQKQSFITVKIQCCEIFVLFVSDMYTSHLYLYSAFNNTNCNKALHNIKIGKLCQ